MLLGTLGASLLVNTLAGKRINRSGDKKSWRERAIATRQGLGIVRASCGSCSSKMVF